MPFISGGDSSSEISVDSEDEAVGEGLTVTNSGSGVVSSSQDGVISAPNGANILIPSGAVPLMQDGSEGEMNFSIRQAEGQTVTLPENFNAYGPVYELGPEGFTFSIPVQVTLPIPDGVNPADVQGLSYYDQAEGKWMLVPGGVDEEARTVTMLTTHFSYYSIFGAQQTWSQENGGWFTITNNWPYNSGSYSFIDANSRGLPMTITYGVCIVAYNLDQPQDASNWSQPEGWQIMQPDDPTSGSPSSPPWKWWMPAGNYQLIEVIEVSEVNPGDPNYVPHHTFFSNPLQNYRLNPNQTLAFEFGSLPFGFPSGWTEGRPICYGREDTSAGTGDVQVTLTWQSSIDLDLHVIEPNGEEIYYNNPQSSSGGTLDRDNACGEMIIGRAENIFWSESGAPSGEYQVKVEYFDYCDQSGPVNYTVSLSLMGKMPQTYTGTIGEYETVDVVTFTIP